MPSTQMRSVSIVDTGPLYAVADAREPDTRIVLPFSGGEISTW